MLFARNAVADAAESDRCTLRSARSFMSIVRGQVMRRGSMPSALPCCRWLSSIAASSACALEIAWKSPVKWRLMSSIGTTCAYPPPAAPPFTPNTGPRLGSRMQSATFLPMRRSACARPTDTVLFPSPAGVGFVAVTTTSRPRDRTLRDLERDLRLVLAVEIELVALESELGGDVLDRTHLDALGDLDIGRNGGHRHDACLHGRVSQW